MAIKKYTNGAWVPTSYRKYGTETDTITSLPAQIIGDGQAITSCQISGNTMQDGTPTPDAPVDVVGCGVRTANLFDKSAVKNGYYINDVNGDMESSGISLNASDYIYIGGLSKVYIGNQPTNRWGAFYDSAKAYMSGFTAYGSVSVPTNAAYVRITVLSASLNTMMINAGSTAMPYEPYGYKLPLTVNGTEYPIYLGQVETTRRIKKLVFDGTENWGGSDTSPTKQLTLDGYYLINAITCVCTHYNAAKNVSAGEIIPYNSCCFYLSPPYNVFFLKGDESSEYPKSIAGFKAWLAAQYAAGTPVTVWYVLATPETDIINEPLHKIGDYADTVSATNIPTTGTAEQFDIQTTLKPSEVQLTYHGWHEHTDTKYTQGE